MFIMTFSELFYSRSFWLRPLICASGMNEFQPMLKYLEKVYEYLLEDEHIWHVKPHYEHIAIFGMLISR